MGSINCMAGTAIHLKVISKYFNLNIVWDKSLTKYLQHLYLPFWHQSEAFIHQYILAIDAGKRQCVPHKSAIVKKEKETIIHNV